MPPPAATCSASSSHLQCSAVSPARRLPVGLQFMAGSCGTMCACVISNPFEVLQHNHLPAQPAHLLHQPTLHQVVKTRLQLQGELQSAEAVVATGQRRYSGVIDAFRKIARHEGLRGLQAGLLPGVLFQASMNGTRLGLFAPVKSFLSGGTDSGWSGSRYIIIIIVHHTQNPRNANSAD